MLSHNTYHQEEKAYTAIRFTILLLLTFLSLAISSEIISQILYVRLILGGLVLISMLHYSFIVYQPDTLVSYRKNILIFLDLLTLTFFIYIFGSYGIFLFPFYILIVMQNALSFGKAYLYTSIAAAILSWILLSIYSPYWHMHYDIIIAFAMTTLLAPLFYRKFIVSTNEYKKEFRKAPISIMHDENHDMLTGIANRAMYKEMIQKTLKRKESFILMFIDLNKNNTYENHIRDDVLQEVAKRLQKSISHDDFLARLGSNEFVIISRKQRVFLRKFLKKIEDNVMGYHSIGGINIRIEINIGVSLYPEDGQTEMIIGKCADDAMHAAKENPNAHHMFYRGIKS